MERRLLEDRVSMGEAFLPREMKVLNRSSLLTGESDGRTVVAGIARRVTANG